MFDRILNQRSRAGTHMPLLRLISVAVIISFILAPAGVSAAANTASAAASLANRVVFFASDGMRPDLMEQYAANGFMPTYAALMAAGARGDNGMVQAFPPNTGVGWYTMMTGAYPGEHGSTNNTYFRSGESNFNNRTSFSALGTLQADTLAAAAERAGKKVAQVDWVGGLNSSVIGPTVDFATFYTNRGVLVGQSDASEQAGAAAFGTVYQPGGWVTATGWTGVPTGDDSVAPPMEVAGGWSIPNTNNQGQNPNRTYNVYAYDSIVNGSAAYDHVVIATNAKDGSSGALDLAVGDFKGVKVTLIGSRAGQKAGHYIKLISLAPDLSNFKLYATSIARPSARCGTAACNALPHLAGEDPLEAYIANNLLPWAAADFAPEEGGVIDEDTYVQQGRDLEAAYGNAILDYILGTLQKDTDIAFVGYPFTDEVSHQFMALVTMTDIDGNPNPCYDVLPKFNDTVCTGAGTANLVAKREGYIRSAYHEADAKLGKARTLMGGNPTTFAASDHGFGPQWWAVNANAVLNAANVNGVSLHASNANASNCGAAATDIAKGCWAGGTIQIYINPAQLQSTANPGFPTYEAVRTAIINAFQNLTDPANPNAQVVLRIMKKEELRNVDGSDSLNPNRSGDVVVVLRPPYQADAGTNGQKIALSHFFGQHGYLPELVDLAHNVNMHATFVAAGPGIRHQNPLSGVRAVDLAPTLAFLLNIPGPQNARGRILYNLTPTPGQYKEVTILDISDYHGQLVPLSEAADNLAAPGVNASFGIGGSSFLKPWFDLYRAEAPNGSLTVAAGDSVGATPPISTFFGDTPTIELMNDMGIGADGLGNHNFDKGSAYLRNTLIPLANYPFLSANVVDANGQTPTEWKPSQVFDTTFGGVKVGIVGFTNDDAPTLVALDAFDPFHVANSLAAVNVEAGRLKSKGINTIIAIGHLGATAGTLTSPTGPLLDLANGLTNVDAVIGDHTDFQVLTTLSNGVLVTENRSKGIRFTRVRLVVDTKTKKVVYKTADFHKPWDIGVAPDAGIQAKIDNLNAQLAPIFNTVLGKSMVIIPRKDACAAATGRTDGRACESLIGDLVTDALRQQYGTDFALTNSGGLRADLTCPAAPADPNANDFCPASLYPVPDSNNQYPITRGQVLGVLPFGNVSATLTISGADLKDYLETAVSSLPNVTNGRFGQVSGLCFTFNVEGTPAQFGSNGIMISGTGNRVTGAVRQAADGTCTGDPVSFAAGVTYTLTTNDFTAGGGDGYPNNRSRITTRDILDQDLADYLASVAGGVVSPTIQGRIHCFDPNPGTGNDCPVGSP